MLRGLAWLIAGGACGRIIGFVTSVALAHVLGPEVFGELAFGLALGTIFSVCASFGLDDLLVRDIARNPRRAGVLLGHASVLRLAAVPLGIIGVAGLAFAGQLEMAIGLALGGYGLLNSYLLAACAVFRAHGRMRAHALLLTAQVMVTAALAVAAGRATSSLVVVSAAYAMATGSVMLVAFGMLVHAGSAPIVRWRPAALMALARAGVPFAITLIGLLALDRLALVCISVMSGAEAAGWFGAAHTIVLALAGASTAAMMAVYPYLARVARLNPASAAALVRRMTSGALAAGVAIGGLLYVLAPTVIGVLFGSAYSASAAVLQRMAFGMPAIFANIVLVAAFGATDRPAVSARAIVLATVGSGLMCALATWTWGYLGGALAYAESHALLVVLLVAMARTSAAEPHQIPAVMAPAA
jgi:O-antigen/teichoic acid export membrane protein